jgi:predicted HicB family RNase H-like nuclease
MIYKGYTASITYDDDANLFHGEVVGTKDVITFQGKSVKELETAFRDSVEDYMAFCKKRNVKPDKPFSGKLVLRMPVDLHREIAVKAQQSGVSINNWITRRLNEVVTI